MRPLKWEYCWQDYTPAAIRHFSEELTPTQEAEVTVEQKGQQAEQSGIAEELRSADGSVRTGDQEQSNGESGVTLEEATSIHREGIQS